MASSVATICVILMSMVILETFAQIDNQVTPPSPTTAPQPAYQPQGNPAPVSNVFVPHVTYPYADAYGQVSQYESFYPGIYPMQASNYMTSLIPGVQAAFQLALKFFAKVGLFMIGGVSLLLVGGIFTTAVCHYTTFCKLTFPGFAGLDKATMRSLMTPEKISTAAALVQDAIGKYQRLQRAASN